MKSPIKTTRDLLLLLLENYNNPSKKYSVALNTAYDITKKSFLLALELVNQVELIRLMQLDKVDFSVFECNFRKEYIKTLDLPPLISANSAKIWREALMPFTNITSMSSLFNLLTKTYSHELTSTCYIDTDKHCLSLELLYQAGHKTMLEHEDFLYCMELLISGDFTEDLICDRFDCLQTYFPFKLDYHMFVGMPSIYSNIDAWVATFEEMLFPIHFADIRSNNDLIELIIDAYEHPVFPISNNLVHTFKDTTYCSVGVNFMLARLDISYTEELIHDYTKHYANIDINAEAIIDVLTHSERSRVRNMEFMYNLYKYFTFDLDLELFASLPVLTKDTLSTWKKAII